MRLWGWLALLALGCTAEEPPLPTCVESATRSGLTAPARYLLGEAAEMPRDPSIAEREDELNRSQVARRALGWAIAERALTPVAVELGDGSTRSIPRFQTFYDREDLRRVYRHLTAPYTADDIDAAFAWNTMAVLEQEAWPPDRLATYTADVVDEEHARGLGGISALSFGPRTARHFIASHDEIVACQGNSIERLDERPDRVPPLRERREVVDIEGCASHRFGPYFVAEGGELRAEARGDVELSAWGPNVSCLRSVCTATGPARIEIVATASAHTTATLDVAWDDGSEFWHPCLAGGFPPGSTVTFAQYSRVGFGFDVPVYDTSAAGLVAVRRAGWNFGELGVARADPGPDAIFTLELPEGERYRLLSLHILVKELAHWVWVTLFWSQDPATDFGADRPAFAEGTPWANYKMCVVTGFEESDPDPSGGATDATLAAALEVVHEGVGMATWCANPYFQRGSGSAGTNCIGCHQHAGGPLDLTEILTGDRQQGRLLARTNFPSDYVWGASRLVDIFLEP